MENVQPTQEATQALQPGRRSTFTIPDAEDIICLLRPNSVPAYHIVENAARSTPQHVLFEDTDIDLTEDVKMDDDEKSAVAPPRGNPRSLALRMSSNLRDLPLGFVFGREPKMADINFSTGIQFKRISARHFRIYLNDSHVLMIEDQSTNGTRVDRHNISCKSAQPRRMLSEGTQIAVAVFGDPSTRTVQEAVFTVSLPERDPQEYAKNLNEYIQRINKAKNAQKPNGVFVDPGPPSANLLTAGTSQFHHGMHWSGHPKYKVVGKTGNGAFATVYQLSSIEEGNLLAAKEIDIKRVVKDGIMNQTVNNELAIMKKLSHPHVVQFCEWQEYHNWLYIIMEFVPCGDLSPFTTHHSLLAQDDVRQVAHQMCQALEYIHARGITHRDIKPENILVHRERPLVVKLTDFGLSKMVQTDNETFLKTFCGTLLYCAPEVYPDFERLRNDQPSLRRKAGRSSPYSSAVDIWSFGAVLHQLFVAQPPIKGVSSGAQMLEAILRDEIDYRNLHRRGVSAQAIDLLKRMLTIDASERITAAECLQHPWLAALQGEDPQITMRLKEGPQAVSSEQGAATSNDPSRLGESKGELVGKPGKSDSFANAAAGLLDSRRSDSSSVRGFLNNGDLSDILPNDEEPSQWSPRDPMPTTAGSDSDEILPDVQETANQIADGRSSDGANGAFDGSFITGNQGFGQQGQVVSDSFSTASDVGRSMITELTPLQAAALKKQAENQVAKGHLFGEVNSSGFGESGIFGHQPRPFMQQGKAAHSHSSLHGAEEQMDVLQVSPPQVNGGRLPHDRPPANSLPKRILELSGDLADAESASKRSMTRGYRIPSAYNVSFAEPPTTEHRRLLGTLTPRPGSISTDVLRIYDRLFMWGRYENSTAVWPDPRDTRVPKCGIDILFCQPGRYTNLHQPPAIDSQELQDCDAVLVTRKRAGLRVNGVQLNRPDFAKPNAGGFPCGRLRTGDQIEVFRNRREFLVYDCEFRVGQSAALRAPDEPFVVEEDAELLRAAEVRRMLHQGVEEGGQSAGITQY